MALAAVVAASSLLNQFVYDDVLVIVENRLVHDLASAPEVWTRSYWPVGMLYRPLAIQLFSVEWALGGGRPIVFHAVSILLYALTALMVWRLAARVVQPPQLPDSPAPWLAAFSAALFAVHPVHVESFANVVGQSELLCALFTLLAVERYVAWRGQGAVGPARRLALVALTLLAIFSKETGYVAPLLMGVAELTLYRRPRGVAPVFVLQGGAVVAALLVRLNVLGGVAGERPTAALEGLGLWERAVGMLAVVPEWVRLLVWPWRLQGEYGPPALSMVDAPAGARLLGLALLLAAAVVLVWGWRRRKLVAFAVLWIVVAIFPVSNLLAPTGIVLAERTLFLPSVGAVLLVAALVGGLAARLAPLPRAVRMTAAVAAIALLVIAGVRSADRALVWRTPDRFFRNLEVEAPRTYRAHQVASRFYYGERRYAEAERAGRRALELYRGDFNVHDQLGQVLRTQGRCGEAIPILAEGVAVAPAETTIRSRLIECMLAVGDSAGARRAAAAGVAAGQPEFSGTLRRLGPATR
jgi:protein O-mannosyl-transferase